MSQPPEFITITDNAGREKQERVEYTVKDARGELVHVTSEGLQYATDSLQRKRGQTFLLAEFAHIPNILKNPDIVVWDYATFYDTLLYYKIITLRNHKRRCLVCVVVKQRQGVKFFYNFFVQESGKVKGYDQDEKPEIWYLHPQKRKRQFGL